MGQIDSAKSVPVGRSTNFERHRAAPPIWLEGRSKQMKEARYEEWELRMVAATAIAW
jgi:hypothetical protein